MNGSDMKAGPFSTERRRALCCRLVIVALACLLPGASAANALQVAERIRASFEGRRVNVGNHVSTSTVSIGIAMADNIGSDLVSVLAAADRALYQAKAKGRNRVEHARPPSPPLAPVSEPVLHPEHAAA